MVFDTVTAELMFRNFISAAAPFWAIEFGILGFRTQSSCSVLTIYKFVFKVTTLKSQ